MPLDIINKNVPSSKIAGCYDHMQLDNVTHGSTNMSEFLKLKSLSIIPEDTAYLFSFCEAYDFIINLE